MEIQTINYSGIDYSVPEVTLLNATPLLIGELAGRTAYNSFKNSEHSIIQNFDINNIDELDADHSKLLDDLAWTYFHHSVLEHISFNFLIKGTSRGTLIEHSRHRIQSLTVKSTRYTMGGIINAYIASISLPEEDALTLFETLLLSFDMFVTTEEYYNKIQIQDIWRKLNYQYLQIEKEDFYSIALSKDARESMQVNGTTGRCLFDILQSSKQKRNVGDSFKHIVNDNWKVDMVVTMNLRALKNYLSLRDSGSAYFLIQSLAKQIKQATPSKYLDLIIK